MTIADDVYVKTIFSITTKQHEFLKQKAFNSRQSMADIVRDYILKDMKSKSEELI